MAEASQPDRDAVISYLQRRGVTYTTWAGWQLLDAHEIKLGEPHGRKRVKVVPREDMITLSNG